MLRQLIAIGCISAVTAAVAEPVALTSEAIKETITGSLLEIDTPGGMKLPVRFSEDGLLSGEAGELASYLGAARDRGRWWVAGDQLCYKWFKWFGAEVRCLLMRREGSRIHWRQDDGYSGTATITEQARPSPPLSPSYALNLEQAEKAEKNESRDDRPAMQFAGMAALGAAPGVGHAGSQFDTTADAPKLTSAPEQPGKETVEKEQPTLQGGAPPAAEGRADQVVASNVIAAPQMSSLSVLASFSVAGVDEDDILNVRSGPSPEHAAIGAIPPQSRGVKIIGPCLGDWCPIRHRTITGWVNRIYLVEEHSGPGRRAPDSALIPNQ